MLNFFKNRAKINYNKSLIKYTFVYSISYLILLLISSIFINMGDIKDLGEVGIRFGIAYFFIYLISVVLSFVAITRDKTGMNFKGKKEIRLDILVLIPILFSIISFIDCLILFSSKLYIPFILFIYSLFIQELFALTCVKIFKIK